MLELKGVVAEQQENLAIKKDLVGHCTKRSLHGHWMGEDGKCIECGITRAQLARKFRVTS